MLGDFVEMKIEMLVDELDEEFEKSLRQSYEIQTKRTNDCDLTVDALSQGEKSSKRQSQYRSQGTEKQVE